MARMGMGDSPWDELIRIYPDLAEEADAAEYSLQRTGVVTEREFCALVGKRTGQPTNIMGGHDGNRIEELQGRHPYKRASEICAAGTVWRRWERILRELADAIDNHVVRGCCLNALNGVVVVGGDLPPEVEETKRKLGRLGITVPVPEEGAA